MADNITLNAGSGGSVLASDDIASVFYQRVKLIHGADGTNDGDVSSANGLPVILVANSGVDIGDVDVTSLVPGVAATSLGKAEDAAHTTGDTGVMALTVRNDTLAALAGTDGDYAPIQVNASGAIYVAGNGTFTVDGSGVTQPVSGTVTANAGTGTFTVDGSGVTQPVSGTVTANAGTGTMTVDNGGTFAVQVDASLPAGTNAIGKLSANAGVNIGDVNLVGATSGGLSIVRNLDVDESGDNAVATACQLYGYYFHNANASTLWLKLYNDAGAPTVGTDTPLVTLGLPAGASGHVPFPQGIAFSTGLGVGATTGVADNDTGAPSANDVVLNLFYK